MKRRARERFRGGFGVPLGLIRKDGGPDLLACEEDRSDSFGRTFFAMKKIWGPMGERLISVRVLFFEF